MPSRILKLYQVVAGEAVTAITIIQSRCQPARRWGVDWTKNLVACIQIDSDGDYIYTPDFSHAVPVTEHVLSKRIDGLITEDISTLYTHGKAGPEPDN